MFSDTPVVPASIALPATQHDPTPREALTRELTRQDDVRELLANDRPVGPAAIIQIPVEMITTLHGMMIDVDLHLLRADALPAGATESPELLHELVLEPMLARHPVFARAEVRTSGRGLHVLLLLDPPVVFTDAAERDRWAASVKVVQSILPSDPDAPGIAATTRPVGSVNSKTGRRVEVLKPGAPVAPDDVLKLVEAIRARPFAIVAKMLVGGRTSPCPVCRKPGTRLGVQNAVGRCYGSCRKVTIGQLFGAFMHFPPTDVKE